MKSVKENVSIEFTATSFDSIVFFLLSNFHAITTLVSSVATLLLSNKDTLLDDLFICITILISLFIFRNSKYNLLDPRDGKGTEIKRNSCKKAVQTLIFFKNKTLTLLRHFVFRIVLISTYARSCSINVKLKNLITFTTFFFYLGFLTRTFTNHRTAGEEGGHFFNSSLPLPPASQTLAERLLLRAHLCT